jgi:hypothetical protein
LRDRLALQDLDGFLQRDVFVQVDGQLLHLRLDLDVGCDAMAFNLRAIGEVPAPDGEIDG